MKKLLFILTAALFMSCASEPQSKWVIESDHPDTQVVETETGLELAAAGGLTAWYKEPIKGNYRITYTATQPMAGNPCDRLSDLNCFWAAQDPQHADDFFFRSEWREGKFAHYNTLNLFYVGFGGNDNGTTRFRRYFGDKYGQDASIVKPLIKEYSDPQHLLVAGHEYKIEIVCKDNLTTYSMDGEEMFRHELTPGMGDGWFGVRLWKNYTIIKDFKIEQL